MAPVNRYSAIVWWIKLILPILGIVLLSSLFLLSRNPDPDAAIPFADVDVQRIAADQRLSQPRFAGTLEDGRAITLVSQSASPSAVVDDLIDLDQVEARVELSDSAFMMVDAQAGRVDLAAQRAELEGNVDIRTTQGYRLSSDAIEIAMDALHLLSPGPVEATGPGFTLEAGAMEVSGAEDGTVLSFTDGVRLLYGTGN